MVSASFRALFFSGRQACHSVHSAVALAVGEWVSISVYIWIIWLGWTCHSTVWSLVLDHVHKLIYYSPFRHKRSEVRNLTLGDENAFITFCRINIFINTQGMLPRYNNKNYMRQVTTGALVIVNMLPRLHYLEIAISNNSTQKSTEWRSIKTSLHRCPLSVTTGAICSRMTVWSIFTWMRNLLS